MKRLLSIIFVTSLLFLIAYGALRMKNRQLADEISSNFASLNTSRIAKHKVKRTVPLDAMSGSVESGALLSGAMMTTGSAMLSGEILSGSMMTGSLSTTRITTGN